MKKKETFIIVCWNGCTGLLKKIGASGVLSVLWLWNHCKGKHANHMTMTTSWQIMSWADYLKTKGNVNIKLWDLCETLIVYILLSTFQLVHMVFTVNKPDVRRFIAIMESADWIPWKLKLPSLFAAWLFLTFHNKLNNMKALVILSHSWSPLFSLTCLYGKKWTFVELCAAFWSIFVRKNSPDITHSNHMTMTTSGQI